MKISFDIDCTPEEARAFLGLPDVSALQTDITEQLRARMMAGIESMDPEAMLKAWMPAGIDGWEKMVKGFWDQMSAAAEKKD